MEAFIHTIQAVLFFGGLAGLAIGGGLIQFSSSSDFSQEGERQQAHKFKPDVQAARGLDLTADKEMIKVDNMASDWGERIMLYGAGILVLGFILGPAEFTERISSIIGIFFG